MSRYITSSTVSLATLLETTRVKRFKELLDPTQGQIFNNTPLGRVCNDLLAFFAQTPDFELDPAKLHAEVALSDSVQQKMAAQVIHYGYCSRYQEENALVEVGHNLEPSPGNVMLVAVQGFAGGKIVLGTLRITWESLEVFQLFEMPAHMNWPHQLLAQKPGEAGRFSLHPILDLLSTSSLPALKHLGDTYKALAFTKLRALAYQQFKEKQIKCMYYIANPMTQQFFSRMGIRSTRCEEAMPGTTQEAQIAHQEWKHYFQFAEDPESQSHVYYCSVESLNESSE